MRFQETHSRKPENSKDPPIEPFPYIIGKEGIKAILSDVRVYFSISIDFLALRICEVRGALLKLVEGLLLDCYYPVFL